MSDPGSGNWRNGISRKAIFFSAALFFAGLTFLFHADLFLRPGSALHHLGDPALNAWILSWNLHALADHPLQIWDANIFFPYRRTLAYSENLLVPSLLLLPARAMTANPVALYHASLLGGIFLSALAAFALGYRVSGSFVAALIPGIAFAFCPFRLGHYGHLQMQHGAFIPLALLGFLVYRDRLEAGASRRFPVLAATALCVLFQFASNMYFALFLTTVLLMWQVLLIRGVHRELRIPAVADAAILWALVAVLVLPLAVPYLLTQREMGFGRNMQEIVAYSADVADYFKYNARNLWFGTRTPAAEEPEHSLTPGILLAMLAICLVPARWMISGGWTAWFRDYRGGRKALFVLDALIGCVLIMLVVVYIAGGIHIRYHGETVTLLGVKLTVENPGNSVGLLLLLIVARAFVAGWRPRLLAGRPPSTRALLWTLVIFSVVMSFGPQIHLLGRDLCPGPYRLFHEFFPGFGGIRAPARYAVFVPLALGLLAVSNLESIGAPAGRRRLLFLLPVILMPLEFASFRPQLRYVYDPPPITRWLRQADPGGVFELRCGAKTTGGTRDLEFVLPSVIHWQHLFNGYSGHAPPANIIGHHVLRSFPEEPSGALLNLLGIRYVVVHDCTTEVLDRCSDLGFERLAGEGGGLVFSPPVQFSEPTATGDPLDVVKIPPEVWSVTAFPSRANVDRFLKDGNPRTAWRTLDTQDAGMFLEVAFDRPRIVSGIQVSLGAFASEFPRSYLVKAATPDGRAWQPLESVHDPVAFIESALVSPKNPVLTIRFPARQMSRLRFETTDRVPGFGLAVADLEILGGGPGVD